MTVIQLWVVTQSRIENKKEHWFTANKKRNKGKSYFLGRTKVTIDQHDSWHESVTIPLTHKFGEREKREANMFKEYTNILS